MPIQRTNPSEPPLTPFQRTWLSLYLGRCKGDAVEAVRLAGFSDDESVIRKQAERLLKNHSVRWHIEKLTAKHMAPVEVLDILAAHARGDMGDFWKISPDPGTPPELDLRKAAELGLTRLIKKLKIGKDGAVELELYDAQAALREVAKIMQMYRGGDSSVSIVVQHVLRAVPTDARDRVLAALAARMGSAITAGEEEPAGEIIDVEPTSPDESQALAIWDPETPVVHGFGDEPDAPSIEDDDV